MKPDTIKAIFTNLLFVIGVILTIIGFISGTSTVVKLAVFDTYPLDSWEETKCDQAPYLATPLEEEKRPSPVGQDLPRMRDECRSGLERERKVHLTEDIVTSISFIVAGLSLVYFFRKYILK